MHPLNGRLVGEFSAHFGYFCVRVLIPDVVDWAAASGAEAIKLLCLKAHTDHENFVVIHFAQLLDGSIVEASAIADTVAVFHEAHERNDHDLREHLFLVFTWFVHAEQVRFDEVVAPTVLTEHERLFSLHDDGQRVIEIVLGVFEKLGDDWCDVHFKRDRVV